MSIETILIISAVCGLIGLLLGLSRSAAFDGFLYGLFLGPIGLLLILIFHGNQKKCPFCQKYIDPKASKCPHCQSEIIKSN